MAPTVHASAVLAGARAVLIQGPSGSGKSRLALALLQAAESGALRFARLVGDDRVHLEAANARLLVRPAETLAGRIEVRGLGIRRVGHEPVAVVGLVVGLGLSDVPRIPDPKGQIAVLEGIRVPRLAVAAGIEPFPLLLAYLRTAPDPV